MSDFLLTHLPLISSNVKFEERRTKDFSVLGSASFDPELATKSMVHRLETHQWERCDNIYIYIYISRRWMNIHLRDFHRTHHPHKLYMHVREAHGFGNPARVFSCLFSSSLCSKPGWIIIMQVKPISCTWWTTSIDGLHAHIIEHHFSRRL